MKKLFSICLLSCLANLFATAQTLTNYQAIVLAQNPSSYFTFDGGSLASIAGNPVTLSTFYTAADPNGNQLQYDVFGNSNNAVYFTSSGDAVYDANESADQLLAGGGPVGTNTSTASGTITFLFRSTDPGPPPSGSPGQHYVFYGGGDSGTSNQFNLFFESQANLSDPGSLKLNFGDTTTVIIRTNELVPDTWYYFALTYNETVTNVDGTPNTNKATWYLGRLNGQGTLENGAVLTDSNAIAGDGEDFYIGCQGSLFKSSFRNPGDGRVDEFAIWKRQLSSNEIWVQFTNLPNVALPSRDNYQSVVTGQSPSHYFKFDGDSTDSINSSLVLTTNGSAPLLGYSFGYFEDNPGGVYFAAGPDALFANNNLVNGGGTVTGNPGTGRGAISLLFHPLAGTNNTGGKFIFSAGGSTTTSNGLALFFEDPANTNSGGALKLRFGNVTRPILSFTDRVSEWYYFAMTYDETQVNPQVNWWLARPGTPLQSGSFTAASGSLAGGGGVFYIGNEVTGGSGFRGVNSGRQSNGQVDEFAIWNRLLTSGEVTNQFNALTVSAQPAQPPTLSIEHSGANVILSWPSNTDPAFTLQSSPTLTSPLWLSAGAAVIVGNNYTVTNPISSGTAQFYRLIK
ncbi:MAG TPA: hypothetical protein VHG71_13250 [Verrucomicrobiae bacterium]|nr:hypothetical protein [Verrucomicrobiae bacterium]